MLARLAGHHACEGAAPRGPVQLDFTVSGIRPISEGHSLISLCRARYKYLYGGAPYKPPKIAENRAAQRRRLR
jgi:hypothetical protein